MFIHCPSCGAENLEDANYCSLCFSTLGFGDENFWVIKRDRDFEIGMSPKPITGTPREEPDLFRMPEESIVEPKRVTADPGNVKGITGAPVEGAISYIQLSDRFKKSLDRGRRGETGV
ncbi:MAG: zinc ribbon domain-containing protein [Actinobacteria bacterium]|nr:zinc ribbon domain-containing protein [Actinomycetota bacterium]